MPKTPNADGTPRHTEKNQKRPIAWPWPCTTGRVQRPFLPPYKADHMRAASAQRSAGNSGNAETAAGVASKVWISLAGWEGVIV
ncbi:uncharacterized protein N7473_000918 [Penicillium subrubescens]|uniref:Uncharacterized protein n=1 Tax=Penicillium subrubescens TaxID=1316194 RepID=A0A1Q5T0N2_9EURO|nr:uncharacterized protein N7473_000918 [Penicillium subrubescens]KAJ5911615.1 hypothetical protein N7473_000918 [Penicillium subrubescens]OKO93645.1 hypothetical protein PENSUB_11924 [Penicillium subrubescens]